MDEYVLPFEELDRTQASRAGGKAANLGELSRIEGVLVPAGFCVTATAFRRMLAKAGRANELADRVAQLRPSDSEAIRSLSSQIRSLVEQAPVPIDVADAIGRAVGRLGPKSAYAVRSSATGEDSPTTSFAGQHDTFLNVVGAPAVLACVQRCWASFFSERALAYRLRNRLDDYRPSMPVVVQLMVVPQVAGVLFTADPASGRRTVTTIEAAFGLGETLVAGHVNPDVYRVRAGELVERVIGAKRLAIVAAPAGGTREETVEPERQADPALSDAEVLRLAELGRRIEAHFGSPQDIEWCLVDGEFQILQSRPITALFPIPAVEGGKHVFVSVGHQQMMTDAMKPLGISVWQHTAFRPMFEAGGRLFVDIAKELSAPGSRGAVIAALGQSDPLIGDALTTLVERNDFVEAVAEASPATSPLGAERASTEEMDAGIVDELIDNQRRSVALAEREIRAKTGTALVDFIVADVEELKRVLSDPRSLRVIRAGMEAAWWLNQHLEEWLGEKNVADILSQSVPNNVTAQMGLALLDVADVIRSHPEVVAFLTQVEEAAEDDGFLDRLPDFRGGREAQAAILSYLETYGMRCVGEIDITRPRWSERPSMLLPTILSSVRNFEAGEGRRRFEQGLQEARDKEEEVLVRLHRLPEGDDKAAETKRMIERVRTFSGYRELPKYGIVMRYFVYKQALLQEAERLVAAHVLQERNDIFYLTLREIREVIRAQRIDKQCLSERKAAFRAYSRLTPPRVMTSEGEVITGSYRRQNIPEGVLVGLPVSSGLVQGRARVIRDMAEVELEPGDILVTAFTDPSWSPAFLGIAGLVTEVGGLMTHGAVIAREYGLPAVVGVEHATTLIRDGQTIRLHGTEGYVEILKDASARDGTRDLEG